MLNQNTTHYKVSFLIKAFGELIECNALCYRSYQPIEERPFSFPKDLNFLDWSKLCQSTCKEISSNSFSSVLSYLLSNPMQLLKTVSNLPLKDMIAKNISLPSFLYDVTFISLNKHYDFIQVDEEEPIQLLSLKISEIDN